ncbi:MAG: GyrI-like domain-containing protein [Eubacteriales bacterium]|nr:GyrI-like domain-containing protein [Eubacteriales bacterium]MDD4421993.1 GyrI-like domain-containing protein [Eubacteriales bacterium]HBR31434.1 hypothetical protein [Clostridiales bacterium]
MRIKKISTLNLVGLFGDGNKTSELWNSFEKMHLNKTKNSYEVRFYQEESCDCFVGVEEENPINADLMTLTIPESEYAVFDVVAVNGYDSENDNMDKWLSDNRAVYRQREINGKKYVVEIFGDRFNEGIVEICIPIERV